VTDTTKRGPSRRDVLKTSGKVAVASTLAGLAIPAVHAAENNTIQVALVGCGGRGTGAAENALRAKNGPTKLVAMADVFQDRLNGSYDYLKKFEKEKKVEVPSDRKFIGFDAYKNAMDCLRPGDIVILTTPPAFRWVHFTYAIQKGLNVFMEKPVTVDGPSTRKMLKLAEEARAKNLKVGVGLMCRHCASRGELYKRIKDGQIGDLMLLRAYRVKEPEGNAFSGPRPSNMPELHYQIRRFHSFLWASGGCYSDFLIHNIDECCWMKDAWPVMAKALGGRQYYNYSGGHDIDQNFDHYAVEYTFADGAKLLLQGRNTPGCWHEFASYAHGTKGSAIISTSSHAPSKCRLFNTQNNRDDSKEGIIWRAPRREPDPYQLEWDHLLEAIRQDKPYNEAKRGAEASLVTAMGRMAAHTGQIVTFDGMLNCEHEFAPEVDRLKMDSPAPVQAGPDGKYPRPEPGRKTNREF
jgi:predicted dehydrogenase